MRPDSTRRPRWRPIWLFIATLAVCMTVTAVSYAVRSLAAPSADGGPGHRFTAIGFFSASNRVTFNEPQEKPAPTDSAAAVRNLLDDQVEAWNKGDLKGFMAGYWNSPELSFYSGRDIRKGWKETYERYQDRYQKDGREMGRLAFSDLSIEPLADSTMLVRGRWKLEMKAAKPDGLFTLVVKKLPEGWRIVHDHTSIGESDKKP